jgi:hypothetical protein
LSPLASEAGRRSDPRRLSNWLSRIVRAETDRRRPLAGPWGWRTLGSAMSEAREWTIGELVADARPPTDDDIPMRLDWTPLDTREKLIAYLEEINSRRAATDAG